MVEKDALMYPRKHVKSQKFGHPIHLTCKL